MEHDIVPETPLPDSEIDGVPADHSEILRAALIWSPDSEVDPEYPVACFSCSVPEGEVKVSCILITEISSKLLVCVPASAWNRSVTQRVLPAKSLSKVVSVALSAVEPFYRTEESGGAYTRAWVGLLHPEFEENIQLETGPDEEFQFLAEDGQAVVLPAASALVEVADEKFCFATATSAAAADDQGQIPAVAKGTSARLGQLEKAVGGIQEGLSSLLASLPSSSTAAPKAASVKSAAKPKVRSPNVSGHLPGIDPSVVQAALRSGTPMSHLEEFSKLVQRKTGKIGKFPSEKILPKTNVLGESEEELVAEEANGEEVDPDDGLDPVASAVIKLTSIIEAMSGRKKTKDLDDLLDDPSGLDGGAHNLVTSGNQRRQAAVLKALQKSLIESPEQIFQKIEELMLADFGSRAMIPGEPLRAGSFRGWLEHRSRIPNLAPSVRISWSVAGALDSLRAGNVEETKARLGLLLASMDQVACDRGQWLLASEVLLEASTPPFSSFSRHVPPEFGEVPHSRLLDSRWVDALMFRVKELDDYSERRAKLGKKGRKEDEVPKEKDKKKGGGKGKKGNSSPASGDIPPG